MPNLESEGSESLSDVKTTEIRSCSYKCMTRRLGLDQVKMFADLEKRNWDPTGPFGGLSVRAIQIRYGCINIPVQIPACNM